MTLVQLREEQVEAHSAFAKAAEAIEAATATSDLEVLQADFDAAEQRFTSAKTEHESEVARQNRARQQFELQERATDARKHLDEPAPASAGVSVKREPLTYSQHSPHGFFRDLYRRDTQHDPEASERLSRHIREMQVEREAKFDLNSTDANGGYLVPPLWLQNEFVDFAAAGRVVADQLGPKPLPANTDSINLPTIATATTVATQADNGAVSETDATFGTVAGAVKTIAGLQDVSQQLVDRSIPGVDQVIFADLAKQYALTLDTAVINSATSSNLGLLQVAGINSVTYTDASPTVPEIYSKLASAIQQVHTGVYMPADKIFMHPRRWAWFLASLDSSNRPLITPYAPQNAAGDHGGVIAEGLVGAIQGLNVFVDANIPTTLGASTTEDRIIVVRSDECFLYEDATGPYLETFRDVGSGNLTVRFRLHNYWAQINSRRPAAISVLSGTGLIAPTF